MIVSATTLLRHLSVSEPGAVATGPSDVGLGSSDVGLEDSSSALIQQSAISNQQSDDPVATARGTDTKLQTEV